MKKIFLKILSIIKKLDEIIIKDIERIGGILKL